MKSSPTNKSTPSKNATASRLPASSRMTTKKAPTKTEISPRASPREKKKFFTEEKEEISEPTTQTMMDDVIVEPEVIPQESEIIESEPEVVEPMNISPPIPSTALGTTSNITLSRRMSEGSDVSSITQSTFEIQVSKSKSRSTTPATRGQGTDYHPLKFAPDKDIVPVPNKNYTPKSGRLAGSATEKHEQALGTTTTTNTTTNNNTTVSNPKSKNASRATTPARNTSPRTRPIPTPTLSPKERAKLQAQAEEERRKAAEAEYLQQLELERLEAERIEAERLEAIRLEEERKEQERLEAERIERERIEAERLEAERIERERLEAEQRERERLEQIEEEKRLKAEIERKRIEDAARAEAEKKAAAKAKADAKKAEQDALKAKAEKERKLAAERAKQVEEDKKAALEAAKQKAIADRKAAQEALRARAQVSPRKAEKVTPIVVEEEKPSTMSTPSKNATNSNATNTTTTTTTVPAKVSPRPTTTPKKSTSASDKPVIDEEKKAAARARIEAERREQQEKERIAAEKKAAADFAKAETKRLAAEEAARKEEERRKNLLAIALAEQERRNAVAAAKQKAEEDRKAQMEAAKLSAAAEAERKAQEKRERKIALEVQAAQEAEWKAQQKAAGITPSRNASLRAKSPFKVGVAPDEVDVNDTAAIAREEELRAQQQREEDEKYRQLAEEIASQEEIAAAEALAAQEARQRAETIAAEQEAYESRQAEEAKARANRSKSPQRLGVASPTSPSKGGKSPTRSSSRLSSLFRFPSKKQQEEERLAVQAAEEKERLRLEAIEKAEIERKLQETAKAEALAKAVAEAKAAAERERIAAEKAEALRIEKERLEKERLEAQALKEQQEREEQERKEQERKAKEAEDQRLEAERVAALKKTGSKTTSTSRSTSPRASPRAQQLASTTPSKDTVKDTSKLTLKEETKASPRSSPRANTKAPASSTSITASTTVNESKPTKYPDAIAVKPTTPKGRSSTPAKSPASPSKASVTSPTKSTNGSTKPIKAEKFTFDEVTMEEDNSRAIAVTVPSSSNGVDKSDHKSIRGHQGHSAKSKDMDGTAISLSETSMIEDEKRRRTEVVAATELTRLESERKQNEELVARRQREKLAAEKTAKDEADRRASQVELEIKRAIEEAKVREYAEAEARSKREADVRRSGIQQLIIVGRDNRLYGVLAARMDELIQILMSFKCNKESGEEFAKRIAQVANILSQIAKSNPSLSEKLYKDPVDEMAQVVIDAKKYLIYLATSGFLSILLRGDEPKLKFEEFDSKIVELLVEIVTAYKSSSNRKYAMNKVKYNFVIIDEQMVQSAVNDPTALKALSKLLGVDLSEMNSEVNETIKRLSNVTQDITENGAQRQLKHPALKTFWRLYLSTTYKIDNRELVERAIRYIHTEVNPDITDEELGYISVKMQRALDIIEETDVNTITVFELNQSTKHMDPSLDFSDVIQKLCTQETLKIFPAITDELKEQIVWGDGVRDVVQASMRSAGHWTIVYGPQYSGKSFRWLVGAHELDSTDAVVWIDFRDVKTSSDMLSTIATQLSLSVLSLDDVMLEFQRLLDSALEHLSSHCCIVLDHLNLDILDQIGPFMKILKRLQAALRIAIVVITTNNTKPSSSSLSALSKSGKIPIPDDMMTCFEVSALSKDEALKLARHIDVYDPVLLITAARRLPGEIVRLQGLRTNQLSMIITNDKNSTPGSTTDNIISENLSEHETLCAICLYYPLSGRNGDGILFHKPLAWELCNKAMDGKIDLWNTCIDRLLSVGWLRMVGDEGYMIGRTSVLPTHPSWTFVSESDQWEIYYRYWSKEAVQINDLLSSKDQLLGCSYFDSARKHFETLFNDIGAKPPLYGRVRPEIVMEFVCQLSSNIANIFEYRFAPVDGLAVSKAILRILCDGDESGMLPDDKYWQQNKTLEPIIVRASVNLGWYLNRTSQSQVAEQIIQSALIHLNETDALNYAYALNKMAIVLRALGKKEESLDTHQKCLNIRIKALGLNHIETAQSLNNIAIVLNALNRKQDALDIHEKCLKIRLTLLGEKHASTGDTYYNMATVLKDMGRKEETLMCYEKAKIAYIATYGEAHSYVKDVSKKMAELNK